MDILKSRKTAVAVTAVCVAASTLLGSHRSLAGLRRAAEATLEQGSDGSGFSIAFDLRTVTNVAANLHTVAGKYLSESHPEELDSLASARERLENAKSTGERKAALDEVTAQCGKVFAALEEVPQVSQGDLTYLSGFRVDLEAAGDTIRRDGYNDLARQFNDETLGRFPANVLGRLTGVKPLETFD